MTQHRRKQTDKTFYLCIQYYNGLFLPCVVVVRSSSTSVAVVVKKIKNIKRHCIVQQQCRETLFSNERWNCYSFVPPTYSHRPQDTSYRRYYFEIVTFSKLYSYPAIQFSVTFIPSGAFSFFSIVPSFVLPSHRRLH